MGLIYGRTPRGRKLRCPVCKSSHHLVASVLAEHGLLNYARTFNESMGWWVIGNEIRTNNTLGLYLACTACGVFGTESFFDPRAKPPRLYHNRNGFYIKLQLPCDMGSGIFEKIELKCYIRLTNKAGMDFVGMLKVAAAKTAAELPEFLTWRWSAVVEYAKVRLKDFQEAARIKKSRKRKKS